MLATRFMSSLVIVLEGLYFNSFNIRMAIYKCSCSIIKDELLIGHGAGDIEKKLTQCYEEFNTIAFDVQRYNTHNGKETTPITLK